MVDPVEIGPDVKYQAVVSGAPDIVSGQRVRRDGHQHQGNAAIAGYGTVTDTGISNPGFQPNGPAGSERVVEEAPGHGIGRPRADIQREAVVAVTGHGARRDGVRGTMHPQGARVPHCNAGIGHRGPARQRNTGGGYLVVGDNINAADEDIFRSRQDAVGHRIGGNDIQPLYGHAVDEHAERRGGCQRRRHYRRRADESGVAHDPEPETVGVYALHRHLLAVGFGVAYHHAGIGGQRHRQAGDGGLYGGEVVVAVLGHHHAAAAAGDSLPVHVAGRIVLKEAAALHAAGVVHHYAGIKGQARGVDVHRDIRAAEADGGERGDVLPAQEVEGRGAGRQCLEGHARYRYGRARPLFVYAEPVEAAGYHVGREDQGAGIVSGEEERRSVGPAGNYAGGKRQVEAAAAYLQAHAAGPGAEQHAAAYHRAGGTVHENGGGTLHERIHEGIAGSLEHGERRVIRGRAGDGAAADDVKRRPVDQPGTAVTGAVNKAVLNQIRRAGDPERRVVASSACHSAVAHVAIVGAGPQVQGVAGKAENSVVDESVGRRRDQVHRALADPGGLHDAVLYGVMIGVGLELDGDVA